MRFFLIFVCIVISQLSLAEEAVGNYDLSMSELFNSCDFIHNDHYSLDSITQTIQASLKTKLEGESECNASFNQLNTEFDRINALVGQTVKPTQAQEIFDEVYTSYMVNLTQEASLLNLANPSEQARYQTLLLQIDELKRQLYENRYQLQLNKSEYDSVVSTNFKRDIFDYAKSLFTTLNSTPDKCINRIGGWGQVVPAILKVSSLVGSTMGPSGMVVGAGFQAASELVVLLQNTRLKKAITKISQRKNEQILACTYLSLQTTACDLERAKKFSNKKDKIKKIIFRDLENSKYQEYEKFYIALNTLKRIEGIFNSIGEMGSAVTLDVQLITKYFESLRIRPDEIKVPEPSSSDEVLSRFILNMQNRGISIFQFTNNGQPTSIQEQYQGAVNQIQAAKATIKSVLSILQEKRSFLDLHAKLTVNSNNILNEVKVLQDFLQSYAKVNTFPKQYLGLFKASEKLSQAIINFLGVTFEEGEGNEDEGEAEKDDYKIFVENVEKTGRELFVLMSYGSVAQLTSQTALMIPSITFKRFSRPFRALENYYLNRDIINRDNPKYVSFSDYMINESLQVQVINDYKFLSGSKSAFRLDKYETTRRSFEKGFRREINRMFKDVFKSSSKVLSSFQGATGAHMCALFSPYLKENNQKIYKLCKSKFKELDLLSVLSDFNRKEKMKIDYSDACFYPRYKREELGQSILFDRLRDYGFNKSSF